jgi:NADP-dependent 3-hydroxy acid dehydrogenase YdfG
MSPATGAPLTDGEPQLRGQIVVVIGGSAGIGLEVARRARAEGAAVILTGRNPERLQRAATELGATSSSAFDASDPAALARFFDDLPNPIDHVMVTAGGPRYGPLLQMDADQVREALTDHAVLAVEIARQAVGKVRPGGALVLMGGTGGRRISRDLGIASAATAVPVAAQTNERILRCAPISSPAARSRTTSCPITAASRAGSARSRATTR